MCTQAAHSLSLSGIRVSQQAQYSSSHIGWLLPLSHLRQMHKLFVSFFTLFIFFHLCCFNPLTTPTPTLLNYEINSLAHGMCTFSCLESCSLSFLRLLRQKGQCCCAVCMKLVLPTEGKLGPHQVYCNTFSSISSVCSVCCTPE